jgi:hypothetical protein
MVVVVNVLPSPSSFSPPTAAAVEEKFKRVPIPSMVVEARGGEK